MDDLAYKLRCIARLSSLSYDSCSLIDSAADRIEQLERELATQRNSICEDRFTIINMGKELDAERALVDTLRASLKHIGGLYNVQRIHLEVSGALSTYRKARGL